MSRIDEKSKIMEFLRRENYQHEKGNACFVDLSEVFDTLEHQNLRIQIENYGFIGRMAKIKTNFRSETSQFINL